MSIIPNYSTHQHHLYTNPHSKITTTFLASLAIPTVLTRCWSPRTDSTDEERQTLLSPPPPSNPATLTSQYGSCTEILHYGTHSSVRLYARKSSTSPTTPKQLHVVKILRRSSNAYTRATHRLEQALSSTLPHPNLLQAIDTLQNDRGETCLVMPYCAGGDLNTFIATTSAQSLQIEEANCFFKQIMRAVTYLHENSIAHRRLTTENILLTARGAVKIADFGSAEWLLAADGTRAESRIRMQLSSLYPPVLKVAGSMPYLAPEVFGDGCGVDARAGDVWAAGLVYMTMRCGRLLWRMPVAEEDGGYCAYLRGRRTYEGFPPIEGLDEMRCRNVIYAMLNPCSERRIRAEEVLRSEWVHGVRLCDAGEMGCGFDAPTINYQDGLDH